MLLVFASLYNFLNGVSINLPSIGLGALFCCLSIDWIFVNTCHSVIIGRRCTHAIHFMCMLTKRFVVGSAVFGLIVDIH